VKIAMIVASSRGPRPLAQHRSSSCATIPAAEAAAELAAGRQRQGKTVDMRETQIAGIVMARRAEFATRNVKHFSDLNVAVINPWDAPQ
jgi:predicted nucleic acid-binding protein